MGKEQHKLFIGGCQIKDPEQTSTFILNDTPSEIDLSDIKKSKMKVLKARLFLTLITIFIIMPIALLPTVGTLYLAYVYDSTAIGNSLPLSAILSCIIGYILFLWIKVSFFEILD